MTFGDRALLRLVPDNVESARSALRADNITFEEHEIAVVLLENRAGELTAVAAKLAEAGVNLIATYVVGLADDLIPHDYLWALEQAHSLWELPNGDYTLAVKAELAALPSPRIYGGTGNVLVPEPITHESLNEVLAKTKGMRLMGQRFIPDSYMFQNLVFPAVGEYHGSHSDQPFTLGFDGVAFSRCYPRGLDAMAVLGSREALKTLIDEGDTDFIQHQHTIKLNRQYLG